MIDVKKFLDQEGIATLWSEISDNFIDVDELAAVINAIDKAKADKADIIDWSTLDIFADKNHNHDDNYYTESEVDTKFDEITNSMLRKVELTQAEYDALTEKDPNVIYIITDKDDANYIAENQIGIAGGVASLDSSGKVPTSQLPDTENWTFTLEDGSTVTKAVYVG